MQDNTTELGELKSLLFEDEIVTFNKLEKEIKKLQLNTQNVDEIVEKITPLLDNILRERLSHEKGNTIEIYAMYLTNIIEKSTQHHLPNLSRALQPVISPAISNEIEDNQEKMVDALYPIMGGMISKYVANAIAEMMEKINSKVEDGLSLGSYKRKVKAKVSGVSESELLIQESHHSIIRSLFIIDKESALLIAEEHIENQEIDDPHMVASMASAIKDFMNDWIGSDKKHSEVQMLSYGNATLYIESAGSVYLIAFLQTEPDHEERREIQEFFAKIVKQYSHFFQNFEGDDSSKEIIKIKKEMQYFLSKQIIDTSTNEKNQSNVAKYFFFLLLVILLGYTAFMVKEKYDRQNLEQYILEKTSEDITLSTYGDKLRIVGYIESVEHYNIIENIVKEKTHKKIINNIYISPKSFNILINQVKDLELEVLQMKKNIKLKKNRDD